MSEYNIETVDDVDVKVNRPRKPNPFATALGALAVNAKNVTRPPTAPTSALIQLPNELLFSLFRSLNTSDLVTAPKVCYN